MTATWPNAKWFRKLRSLLVIALLLSLALHLHVWLTVVLLQAALKNGWLPPWLAQAVQPIAASILPTATNPPAPPAEAWQDLQLQFVEVDPALVTDEAPPDAPFFSTANTRAANPNPSLVDQEKPRIDGWREDTLKTFDTPRPAEKVEPAQPKATEVADVAEAVAVAPKAIPEPPMAAPKPTTEAIEVKPPPPGETLLAKANPKAVEPAPPAPPVPQRVPTTKPAEVASPTPPQAQPAEPVQAASPKRRPPKRLSEVMPTKGALVGERMKQEGGVARMAVESSLDVKSSPLGDYHYRMVTAVQQRWYRLLEERRYALERIGKVVIAFNLHSDGTITAIETKNSDVGEVLSFLCELSVMQPAPFGRWPPEIRRLIGGDVIPVTFTFNYY